MAFEKVVGFVGLGGMGSGLVKNMLLKGVAVHVMDLNPKKVELAESRGAKVASSVSEMTRTCDVLAFCIGRAEDVQKLTIDGETGCLKDMKPGQIILDHTTTSPDHVDLMSKVCGNAGDRLDPHLREEHVH